MSSKLSKSSTGMSKSGGLAASGSLLSASGHIGNLTQEQTAALTQIKDLVLNIQDKRTLEYAQGFFDDRMYLRFLRARKFVVDAAFQMLVDCIKFRLDFQGVGVDAITMESCKREATAGKSFIHGTDIHGRPIVIVRPRLHDPALTDPQESERYIVFMMEHCRKTLPPHIEQVSLIFDMTGVSRKNMDLKTTKYMVNVLQNYYPESLGSVLIYNSTWLVLGVWKVVKPWLDQVTANKVTFVDDKSMKSFVSENNLLSEYGGKDKYEFSAAEYYGAGPVGVSH